MGQQGSLAGMMLPLAMFAAIFYFMIMRPQKKKQQQHDSMLAGISKGSEVITAGGFFGTVREVLDDSFIIELASDVKVRVLKTSISVKKNDGDKSGEPKKEKKKKKKIKTGAAEDSSVENQTAATESLGAGAVVVPAGEVSVETQQDTETEAAETELKTDFINEEHKEEKI